MQIELKAEGIPKLVNDLILKNKIENNVIITSFDIDLLQQIKILNLKLKSGILFKQDFNEISKILEKIPAEMAGIKGEMVTRELIDMVHKKGKIIYAYHVNEKELGKKLVALGVDEIGTDFPDLFINEI